jgi:hypothetical protein
MASEGPASPPVVILDANLLYPFQLRNLLVQFGVDGAHPQGVDRQPGQVTHRLEHRVVALVHRPFPPDPQRELAAGRSGRATAHRGIQEMDRPFAKLLMQSPDHVDRIGRQIEPSCVRLEPRAQTHITMANGLHIRRCRQRCEHQLACLSESLGRVDPGCAHLEQGCSRFAMEIVNDQLVAGSSYIGGHPAPHEAKANESHLQCLLL